MDDELFTKIEFIPYDLFIPFVCRQCGACCRTYTPVMPEKDLEQIARDLNIPEDELFARHEEHRLRYIAGRPLPCPFNDDKRCLIYRHPLRPGVCRLYPFSYGRPKIRGCPGYDEHSRMVDAFLDGERDYEIYDSSFCPTPGRRPPPEKEWGRLRDLLAASGPSRPAVRRFLRMNGLPVPFLKRKAGVLPSCLSAIDTSR